MRSLFVTVTDWQHRRTICAGAAAASSRWPTTAQPGSDCDRWPGVLRSSRHCCGGGSCIGSVAGITAGSIFTSRAGSRSFLLLDYAISTRGTTLATIRGALCVLDELARLKRSDAILCDVATMRISDRLLARWGWAPHVVAAAASHNSSSAFTAHYPRLRRTRRGAASVARRRGRVHCATDLVSLVPPGYHPSLAGPPIEVRTVQRGAIAPTGLRALRGKASCRIASVACVTSCSGFRLGR